MDKKRLFFGITHNRVARSAYSISSLFIVHCSLLICLPLSAQEQTAQPEVLWISPCAELALYSPSSLSYGGSVAIAYGSGTSIGVKAAWFFDHGGQVNVMVFDVLFRVYFFGKAARSGLFIQLEGGPALYFEHEEKISLPARIGMVNAGLSLGWRIPLGKYFYIEPSISGGYPFIAGASLASGVQF